MSVDSFSDSGSCSADGDYLSYGTATGRSRSFESPHGSYALHAQHTIPMDAPSMQHLREGRQLKGLKHKICFRRRGSCTPCKLAKVKVRCWLMGWR